MKDELAGKLYTSIANANEIREFNMWHASSLAECPRAQYMKRLGVERLNRVGAGKMLRWKAGHIMEEAIRPYVEDNFPDVISNVRYESKKLDLSGEFDNYSELEETIFEIKSVHEWAFAYKKKSDERFHLKDMKPYLNHELQNHAYVRLLEEQGFKVKQITYVYITLDGRIATYTTPVNLNILSEVDKRLELLNSAWATQSPPVCICQNTDHPLYKNTMQYCDYQDGDKCCEIKEGDV